MFLKSILEEELAEQIPVNEKLASIFRTFKNSEDQEIELYNEFILPRELEELNLKEFGIVYANERIYKKCPYIEDNDVGFVNSKTISMSSRVLLPVKSVSNKIIGAIGWTPYDVGTKYLNSKTIGFCPGTYSFYGMENIEEYYRGNKPVFFVEGPMCNIWLRSNGFSSIASLGTSGSKYLKIIINRLGKRAVIIQDNDKNKAGEKGANKIRGDKTIVVESLIAKDIDDTRKIAGSKEVISDLVKIEMGNFNNLETMRIRK